MATGVVIVQMCDLCVAADDARFMFPEAKIGFIGASIAGLAARIPHKVAMELMLVGNWTPRWNTHASSQTTHRWWSPCCAITLAA